MLFKKEVFKSREDHTQKFWLNFLYYLLRNLDAPSVFQASQLPTYPLYVLCTKGLSHPYMCDLEPKHLFLWNNIASKAFIITESYLKMKKFKKISIVFFLEFLPKKLWQTFSRISLWDKKKSLVCTDINMVIIYKWNCSKDVNA